MRKSTTVLFLMINCFAAFNCWAQVIAGGAHSVVLCSDSSVMACGAGYLGDSTTLPSNTLVHVKDLADVVALGAGTNGSSYAIRKDGTLWAWGWNAEGQLGDSSTANQLVPVQVHGIANSGFLNGVTSVSANNYHALALLQDSTVVGWGYNSAGELGDSSRINALVPVKTIKISQITDISAGYGFSLAVKRDGYLWAWGSNLGGQLGNGTSGSGNCDSVPVKVHGSGNVGFLTGVKSVAAGAYHSVALKDDSTVWSWGNNTYGQMGNGTFAVSGCFCETSPLQANISGVIAVEAGNGYTVVLKSDSTVWTWGVNNTGMLGNATLVKSSIPVQVHGPGNIGYLSGILAISSKGGHTLALKKDGTVWAWGFNVAGQLGNGTTASTGCKCDSVPVMVSYMPCNILSPVYEVRNTTENLFVYPNPAQNVLTVELLDANSSPADLHIKNILGEEVMHKPLNGKKTNVDISLLSAGIYFVKIWVSGKVLVKQFIKE